MRISYSLHGESNTTDLPGISILAGDFGKSTLIEDLQSAHRYDDGNAVAMRVIEPRTGVVGIMRMAQFETFPDRYCRNLVNVLASLPRSHQNDIAACWSRIVRVYDDFHVSPHDLLPGYHSLQFICDGRVMPVYVDENSAEPHEDYDLKVSERALHLLALLAVSAACSVFTPPEIICLENPDAVIGAEWCIPVVSQLQDKCNLIISSRNPEALSECLKRCRNV